MATGSGQPGPPPLRPSGLILHHDGSWSHEGQPIVNRRLREAFDQGVRFLPGEGADGEDVYVVALGHFRGQIEIEEAGFFVRMFDAQTGSVTLSDRSTERLEVASLHPSKHGGALLCRVKRDLHSAGLLARFSHAAQAELFHAVEEDESGVFLPIGGNREALPDL